MLFHTDAVQAVGKVPFDVIEDNIDLLSISAHKIYGPKGVGALYVRRKNPRVRLIAQIDGGGHERGMRSGTLNVTGIVGLGKACEIAGAEMAEETTRLLALRDRLHENIMSQLDECYLNGSMEHRLPGNCNISFAYVEGESLMMGINDVAVSSGSACTSASLEPSLRAARPWAWATSWRTARSASALAASTPKPRWTTSPSASSRRCSACASCRRSTRWQKKA